MKCRNNGGTLAYGYSVNKETGALVVNPKTAPIVREIFSRYDKGELIKSIIKDLNARGLRNNFNRPFQASAMTLLLKTGNISGTTAMATQSSRAAFRLWWKKMYLKGCKDGWKQTRNLRGEPRPRRSTCCLERCFAALAAVYMVGECGKAGTERSITTTNVSTPSMGIPANGKHSSGIGWNGRWLWRL